MKLQNIEKNYDINMNIGTVYQSIVNNQLYTLVKPRNILRYSPVEDTWFEVSVTEILVALTNYQYVEYQPNDSNDYIECSFETAYLATDSGIGCAYVKILEHYLPLEKLKASVDLISFVEYITELTDFKFYKDKFARSTHDMDSLKKNNSVVPLNKTYDDIYF